MNQSHVFGRPVGQVEKQTNIMDLPPEIRAMIFNQRKTDAEISRTKKVHSKVDAATDDFMSFFKL